MLIGGLCSGGSVEPLCNNRPSEVTSAIVGFLVGMCSVAGRYAQFLSWIQCISTKSLELSENASGGGSLPEMLGVRVLTLSTLLMTAVSVGSAKSLWSSTPATYGSTDDDDYILKTGYLIGNGKLGGSPDTSQDTSRTFER